MTNASLSGSSDLGFTGPVLHAFKNVSACSREPLVPAVNPKVDTN